jgi:uncharacterized membrane protein
MSGQGDEDRTRVIERGGEQLPPPPPPLPLPPPTPRLPSKPPADVGFAGALGFVGVALMLLGLICIALLLVPIVFIANIVGLILLLIAMNRLAGAYKNRGIWKNAFYAAIAGFVGTAVFSITWLTPVAFIVLLIFTALECGFFTITYDELARSSKIHAFTTAARWYSHGFKASIIIAAILAVIVIPMIVSSMIIMGIMMWIILMTLITLIILIIAYVHALRGFNELRHMV